MSDEEWGVVVDNFPLVQGELTREGFLTLHTMEAEDNDGDEAELRVTLQTMGYNAGLVQDESASFQVSLSSSRPASLTVSALKSPGLLLDKTITRFEDHGLCLTSFLFAIKVRHASRPCSDQGKGSQQCARVQRGVRLKSHIRDPKQVGEQCQHPDGSVKKLRDCHQQVRVKDVIGMNIKTQHFRPSPVFTVSVPKKCSLVAAHVLPLSSDPGAPWNLEAEAKYVR